MHCKYTDRCDYLASVSNVLWGVAFVICWSSGFVGAVLAGPAGSVAGVLAWRYLVTAVLLVAAVIVLRRARVTRRDLAQQAVIGVLAHVVFLGGVFGGSAAGVDAGTAALVCALQPMLVAVAGRWWWGDRVRVRQLVGLAVGLVAVAGTVGVGGSWNATVLLPVASLLGLSGATLLERRWQPCTDPVASLAIQVVVSAAVFMAYAVVSGEVAVAVTPQLIGALAWLVVLSGLGGYWAFLICLRRMGGAATSVLLYLTPPVTTLWVWAMFADPPGTGQVVGLCLGAVAVALALPSRDRFRVPVPEPAP